MRDPAIHIRRSHFIRALKAADLNISDAKVNDLFREAMKYSIRHRVAPELNSRPRKKAERLADTESQWVDMFNGIYSAKMAENHIASLSIHKKDPMYLTLKEITRHAVDFCDLFMLPYDEGFKTYIQHGINILNRKYSLYRLKAVTDRIVSTHRDIMMIQTDPSPDKTAEVISMWVRAMKKYGGVDFNDTLSPDKIVCMIYAKNDADSVGASYKDWINAQFEKWSYLKGVPEFSQLYGDNAKLNYKIFMGKEKQEETEYDKAVKANKEIPLKKNKPQTRIRES